MAKPGEVELGDIVKDSISGFKGVAYGVTVWLHGCRRITIAPEALDKDGKIRDSASFDEPQVEILKKLKHESTSRAGKTGGPRPEPTRHQDPKR